MNRPGTFSTHRVVSTKRTPSGAALRAVLAGLVLVLASAGCFYLGRDDYDEILQKPFKEWTTREDLTVIIACTRHNVHDPTLPVRPGGKHKGLGGGSAGNPELVA